MNIEPNTDFTPRPRARRTLQVTRPTVLPPATFGSTDNLPGFKFPVGSKVRTESGKWDWRVLAHSELPADPNDKRSTHAYQIVALKDGRPFGPPRVMREGVLVAIEPPAPKPLTAPKPAAPTPLAFGPGTGVTFAEFLASKRSAPRARVGRAAAGTTARVNSPFAPDAIVTLLVENPKKPGNKNWERWEAGYKTGRTVAETVRLGVTMGDIKYDVEHGFVRVDAA